MSLESDRIMAMTVDEVRRRVEEIRECADDDEKAHGLEDDLHIDVLFAVAAHHPQSADLAAMATATTRIKFSRWCA